MSGEIKDIKIISEWDYNAGVYKVGETSAHGVLSIRAPFRDEFETEVLKHFPDMPVTIEYDNETVYLGPHPAA